MLGLGYIGSFVPLGTWLCISVQAGQLCCEGLITFIALSKSGVELQRAKVTMFLLFMKHEL